MMLMVVMVVLLQVSEDSVAARCGLRAGDIVVRLCGQSADRMTHLMAQQAIASCADTLEIIVERFTTTTLCHPTTSNCLVFLNKSVKSQPIGIMSGTVPNTKSRRNSA